MAVLPCVNPYPRVRPALAVIAVGAIVGLVLGAGALAPSDASTSASRVVASVDAR